MPRPAQPTMTLTFRLLGIGYTRTMKRCIDNLGAAGLVLAIWFAWWVSNGYWLVGVLVGAIGIFIVLLLSGVAHLLLVDRRPIRRFGEPPEGW